MRRVLFLLSMAAAVAAAQDYKADKAGAPPPDVPPTIQGALDPNGVRVSGPSGPVCDIWWRKDIPTTNNGENGASLTDVAHGAVMGVIHFDAAAQDRRGQAIKPGTYLMRLSFFPTDGAHMGISQTRDFVLLTNAAQDTDLNATPNFKQLVDMSKKASGTNHPLVLNIWKADSPETGLKQEGNDWVVYGQAGGRPVAMIVVGVYTA